MNNSGEEAYLLKHMTEFETVYGITTTHRKRVIQYYLNKHVCFCDIVPFETAQMEGDITQFS